MKYNAASGKFLVQLYDPVPEPEQSDSAEQQQSEQADVSSGVAPAIATRAVRRMEVKRFNLDDEPAWQARRAAAEAAREEVKARLRLDHSTAHRKGMCEKDGRAAVARTENSKQCLFIAAQDEATEPAIQQRDEGSALQRRATFEA